MLVKIKNICIYTAFYKNVGECFNAIKLLKENNIPYDLTHLNDDSRLYELFETFEKLYQRPINTINKLPVVTWISFYENSLSTEVVNIAVGLEEIQNSELMNNLDKLVLPLTEI